MRSLKYLYAMPKYEHLFADKLTYLLINEVGFKNTNFGCLSIISTLQMGKIRSRWEKIVVLSYVDYFIYWYTSEAPGKQFVDTLGKILHVNFLVFFTLVYVNPYLPGERPFRFIMHAWT